MKKQALVEGDVFDICNRLKELDDTYYVVYNLETAKFEVHSAYQKCGSYCFTIPYSQLDDRTIYFARKTSVARKDELIRELDKENEERERTLQKQAVERLKEVLE